MSLVALVLVAGSACEDVDNKLNKEKAVQALAAKNYDEAVIYLKNFLAQNNDSEARELLAFTYYQMGAYESAVKEFDRAYLSFEDVPSKYVQPLLKAYFESENYIELEKIFNNAVPNSSYYYQAAFYHSAMLLRTDEQTAFKRLVENTFAESQDNDSYAGLLSVMKVLAEKDISSALSKLEILSKKDSTNRDVLELTAAISLQAGEFDEARNYYKTLVELAPQDTEALLYYVIASSSAGKISTVANEIQQLYAKFPRSPIINMLLANEHFRRKEFEASAKYAEVAAQSSLGLLQAKFIAGLSNAYLENDEVAFKYLSPLKDVLPSAHPALKLIAILELRLGYLPEAKDSFLTIEPLSNDESELYAIAAMKMSLGNRKADAVEMIDLFAPYADESSALRAKLGALQVFNNLRGGGENLEAALNNGQTDRASKLSLAAGYLLKEDYGNLAELSERWLEASPDDVAPMNLGAKAQIALGNNGRATELLELAMELEPNNPASLELLAFKAKQDGNFEKEAALLNRLLTNHPSYLPGLKAYRQARGASKKDIVAFTSVAFELNNKDLRYAMLHAETLKDLKRPSDVVKVLQNFENETAPDYFYLLYGDSLMALGEFINAERVFKRWSNQSKGSELPYLRLIFVQDLMKTWRSALATSEEALKLWPRSDQFKLLNAKFLNLTEQPIKAKNVLASAQTATKESIGYLSIKGANHFLLGEYAEGEEKLQKVVEARGDIEGTLILAKYYKSNVDWLSLQRIYEQYIAHKPEDLKLRLIYANDFLSVRPEVAENQYKYILSKTPENQIALGNLAWINLQSNKLDDAMRFAQDGLKRYPRNAELLDTMGLIHAKKQEFKEALRLFNLALNEEPKSVSILVNKIDTLVKMGNLSEAHSIIRSKSLDASYRNNPLFKAMKEGLEKQGV
jgi:putative PEP-CTERM system TPR-repeat lipoprotein